LNQSDRVCGWCTLGDISFCLVFLNTKMRRARRVVFVYEMQLWSNNPTATTLAATLLCLTQLASTSYACHGRRLK
jgi:hypothetical protein